ncbi:MAG: tRNA (guanosine(46)-N7)-methyltransferase TrmB [Lacunisphaera sp.]
MDFTPAFVDLIAKRRSELRAQLGAILPQPRSIVLELGCGHGHFLASYAAEFPQKLCIGVDLRSDRIVRALRKAKSARLPNCHFVRTEALEFIQALQAEVDFEEIWVLFPDPWPKKRHHKNRLLQESFFEEIASRTPTGGRLYFRTDFAPYFESVTAIFPALKTWQLVDSPIWPMEHETVFQARAVSYQSLVAIRTTHPARPTGKVASGLPPQATPTSLA